MCCGSRRCGRPAISRRSAPTSTGPARVPRSSGHTTARWRTSPRPTNPRSPGRRGAPGLGCDGFRCALPILRAVVDALPQGGPMPRLLIIAILALSTMIPSMALATAQIPDRILIDGQDYALNTNPLTPRLVASGWLPPKEAMVSSANWRGYTASWEIADGQLMLRDATILVAGEEPGDYTPKSILDDVFL